MRLVKLVQRDGKPAIIAQKPQRVACNKLHMKPRLSMDCLYHSPHLTSSDIVSTDVMLHPHVLSALLLVAASHALQRTTQLAVAATSHMALG